MHNTLGVGFLEKIYARALGLELRAKGIYCEREVPYQVRYRDVIIGDDLADLVVDGRVLVELKAAAGIDPAHEAQTLNYLRVSGLKVGLLLNFGLKPEFKRLIFDNPRKAIRGNPRISVADLLIADHDDDEIGRASCRERV